MKAIALFLRMMILGGIFFRADSGAHCHTCKGRGLCKDGGERHCPAFSNRHGTEPWPSDYGVSHCPRASLLFAGLVAHTALAERIVRVLELSLLSDPPGYDYLKQASASALGVAEIDELPVVFVAMEGGWQFGIQVVAMADGLVAIFVPGAPNPASGSVFFFPADASTRRN